MTDPDILTAYLAGEVDDPVLDELDARESYPPVTYRGIDIAPDDTLPWKLEVPPPIAVDLSRAAAAMPAAAQAAGALAESGRVILFSHSMTALARPGEKPPPVWGMGYAVTILDVDDAATLSVAPDTASERLASASGHLDIGLDASGRLSVATTALASAVPALAALTALPIPDLHVRAAAGAELAASFRLDLTALRVQAASTASGGADWNLYHRGRDLARTQMLVHTVALPWAPARLRVRVQTWIRRKTPFGISGKATQWAPPAAEHDIPVR
jgi:hypothetical protein